MDTGCIFRFQWAHWPWWLAGAVVGLWLVPLARSIPRKVLRRARVSVHAWQGPGGGIVSTVPPVRRIWVPLTNAALWACAACSAGGTLSWSALADACLSSTLLLLALIDWDTTMLPDLVVLPLAAAGLVASHAGLTPHTLLEAAASAVVVPGIMGGLALVFRRFSGQCGIGGGDLKLLGALAAWWGAADVLYVLVLASMVTVAWYLSWRLFNGSSARAEWPFGPAIAVAALAWHL
jgi:leader peptidase (prepilin peptidase)/N-methyltransferase